MALLPKEFPTEQQVQANYNYFDTVMGVGYVIFYPAIAYSDATTTTRFLTTDASYVSDSANFRVIASADIDFDATVEKPLRIAAQEAFINWRQSTGSGGSASVTWSIIHVDTNSVETVLGTVVGDTTGASAVEKKGVKVTLTEKTFRKGEKLRVSANIVIGGGNGEVPFDPSGGKASNDAEGRSVTSQAKIQIPIIIPI